MATKTLEATAPEEQQTASSTKKRKSALTEIEVDLSLPEPPSKKARRALKKGKTLPAKPSSSDDEDNENTAADGKAEGGKDGKKKTKKERSPYGVWIGNLPFTTTKADLRKWLVDNSGGSITEESITRIHMPTTKKPVVGAGPKKTASENRGFAYVDFASFDANVAAIALSETELNGRKLLIKDSKSFEGRPKKEESAAAADAAEAKAASSLETKGPFSGSTKIFVGNLSFNTTEDDLHAHFEKCGKIRWVKVATFEDSGKCKGYGWVNFEEPEAASWAVKGFVKVRETVETLEDFMDEDQKPAETEAEAEGDGDAANDSGEEKAKEESDSDSDAESNSNSDQEAEKKPTQPKPKKTTTTTPKKEPPRTRTRKWWVNQLLGRNLKIELAEDDQTRYHKRFGKGAKKHQEQQQQSRTKREQENGEQASGAGGAGDNSYKKERKKEVKKEANYQTDISVARLTGAAVAPQGKKITFD
ncbi:uncharacterized protein B0T15DRAFT_92650 [Chaetomium strumarium]|uniref:RRM domain-containing protein n=1 Tax=Chaetomium strumarium TaxID=1170767 RepID=A0AAJ0GXJ8_9PEZI|nr:hypothetical protein B0T15DRAFT_92650 [Chaetomium strumarium]